MAKRAEIRMFGFPQQLNKWLLCDGKSYKTEDHPSLFAKIGYTWGGSDDDFNVPDLRGRVPIGPGAVGGEEGTNYSVGATGGSETVTLNTEQIPSHNHPNETTSRDAEDNQPNGNFIAKTPDGDNFVDEKGNDGGTLLGATNTGGGEAHNNVQPYACLSFQIYSGV